MLQIKTWRQHDKSDCFFFQIVFIKAASPSPENIVKDVICPLLEKQVNMIMFMTQKVSRSKNPNLTSGSRYLLNLINHLQIPVLAWNADNSGFNVSHLQLFSHSIRLNLLILDLGLR